MIVDVSKRILIVGLGLLGGSYARVLKRFGFHISAITLEQSSIDYALGEHIIDEGSTTPDARIIGEADLVIFALYPHVFVEWIRQHQGLLKSGALITDVTGVKRSIVYQIQDMLRPDVEFVAAHPMAGREVGGIENADDGIFNGANYIVVPSEKNSEEAIRLCEDLGRELGFGRISRLSAAEHDDMIAFLSQLTHCVAVSLMCANDDDRLVAYTGDSFRDLTRIARINDEMWSELFLLNKEALLRQMDTFLEQVWKMRGLLAAEDREGLREMMRTSTARRAKFDKK